MWPGVYQAYMVADELHGKQALATPTLLTKQAIER
jgi:hypothetical protein